MINWSLIWKLKTTTIAIYRSIVKLSNVNLNTFRNRFKMNLPIYQILYTFKVKIKKKKLFNFNNKQTWKHTMVNPKINGLALQRAKLVWYAFLPLNMYSVTHYQLRALCVCNLACSIYFQRMLLLALFCSFFAFYDGKFKWTMCSCEILFSTR